MSHFNRWTINRSSVKARSIFFWKEGVLLEMALNKITSLVPKSYPNFVTKMKQYLYKITFCAIFDGEAQVIDFSDVIFNFKIFKLYKDFVFPVIAVSVNMTPEQHTKIADNLDRTKFRFSLEKVEIPADTSDPNKVIEKTGRFVYRDMILELSDYDKRRFRDETEQYNGGFENALKIQVYMELFKSEHININKEPVTGIFNNVKMDNLVIHLMSQFQQKTLIQKSNRGKERLPQVVLPGRNLAQTIKHIQNVYGIYKSGLRLFFDFNRAYCLAHDIMENDPISEGDPIEYKNVVCYIGKSFTETTGCYLDEETKTYYMLMPNSDKLTFADKSSKELFGNKMVFKSQDQTKKTMESNVLENKYVVENKKRQRTELELKTVVKQLEYTVKKGDTLNGIAKKYNTTVAELVANNDRITNPDLIYPNQIIKIPQIMQEYVEVEKELEEVATRIESGDRKPKIKYYYNKTANKYAEDELLSEINRNQLRYEGHFKNIDEDYLSMNKSIYLSFIDESYSDYNGMYEVEGLASVFTRFGSGMYEMDTIVSFTRLTKDYLSFS